MRAASGCSCLPPDTNGAAGLTQFVLSANEFPSDSVLSAGAAAIVFERDKMLSGQPARYVWFDEAAANPPGGQFIGQLPSEADGSRLPPAGAPNLFAEVDDAASVPPTDGSTGFATRLWKFHVDWANPASSTFGNNGQPSFTVPVAPFVRPQCVYGYGDCAMQKGGAQGLDVLGDRLMFRLAYRNFGAYQSLVLNHTVKANGLEGIRWYEVRNPGTAPEIRQQGTYAPDDSVTNPLSRWMGSIAMDKQGDIAVGYSASGVNDYPSVRYTGRAADDPLGQMTQAEHVLGVPGTSSVLGFRSWFVGANQGFPTLSLRWPPWCASPSSSSISTAPSSTRGRSSSRRCATRRARCSGKTSPTRN